MARLCPHCETKSRFDDIYPVRSVCSDENGFHFLQRCQECSGIVYSICNVDINAPQYKTAGVFLSFCIYESTNCSFGFI